MASGAKRLAIFAVAAGVLGGCTFLFEPDYGDYGVLAHGFVSPDVADAFVPLSGRSDLVLRSHGSGFLVQSGVGVTSAHNAGFLGSLSVIGTSSSYDLLFFRTAKETHAHYGDPVVGETAIAYGVDTKGSLREARGTIVREGMEVEARCAACPPLTDVFALMADAGPGFSGGPVVDAATGRIVGTIYGYLDYKGHRLMLAYPMSRVIRELAIVRSRSPSSTR